MRLERDDAKIGLLVFLASGLFLSFLFQRSLTAILKKESHYQVQLENVSDVAEGTEVQLQGLRVGQVEAVQLRRDGVRYGFLVALGLRTDIVLWEGTRAQVVAKPLGGSYLDLQLPPPQARVAALAPGAILEGTTGASLATLVEGANTLVTNLNLALTEVREQFHQNGVGALLDHPQVTQVMQEARGTLKAFGNLAQDSQGLVRHGEVAMTTLDRNLASLEKSLAEVQKLLAGRSGDLDAIILHLSGTLKEMEPLARELNTRVQNAGPSGEAAIKALERNLRATEELLELLKAKPSRLLWGKPGEAERAQAARKVQAAREAQGGKP